MSKRINIVLPDRTVALLERVVAKGTRSRFIDRAVLHYIETQGKKRLRQQLIAGYRANSQRDLAMAADWLPLEEEACQVLEESGNAKRVPKGKRT